MKNKQTNKQRFQRTRTKLCRPDGGCKLAELQKEMKAEYEAALYKMAAMNEPSTVELRIASPVMDGRRKDAFNDNRCLIQRKLLRFHPLIQRAFMDLHSSLMAVTLNLTFLHG